MANGGNAPAFYVNDMKTRGKERVTGIQTYIATELNARYWNPKWIREMQKADYAGARAIANTMENLYGWQATSAEHMDGTFWQNSYDVYVADKNGLEMDKFFEQANPHARQVMMARMLEVDRQGSYKFPAEQRAELVRRYVQTVAKIGATCSANTCGNLKLHQYIADQAALVPGLGSTELAAFGRNMAKATGWKAAAFARAPAAVRAGVQEGMSRPRFAPPRMENAATRRSSSPPLPYVNGFRMAQQIFRTTASSAGLLPVSFLPIALIVLLVGTGFLLEALRTAIKGYLMTNLYQLTVTLFYQLANAFFWPVAVALLALLAITLIDLGGLFFTFWRKRRESRSDLPAIARALAQSETVEGALDDVVLSPSLRRFWTKVEARLRETGSGANVDLWLEEVLQQEEIDVAGRLDRTRLFVRIGPMLGLAGTIIPLGPALRSLLGGDMAGHGESPGGGLRRRGMRAGDVRRVLLHYAGAGTLDARGVERDGEPVRTGAAGARSSGRATGEEPYESLCTA